jgi:hypothetical protein
MDQRMRARGAGGAARRWRRREVCYAQLSRAVARAEAHFASASSSHVYQVFTLRAANVKGMGQP